MHYVQLPPRPLEKIFILDLASERCSYRCTCNITMLGSSRRISLGLLLLSSATASPSPGFHDDDAKTSRFAAFSVLDATLPSTLATVQGQVQKAVQNPLFTGLLGEGKRGCTQRSYTHGPLPLPQHANHPRSQHRAIVLACAGTEPWEQNINNGYSSVLYDPNVGAAFSEFMQP